MEKINLFLMDMSEDEVTTGVVRYLETLLRGLASYPDIHVCWIRLIHSSTRFLHVQEDKGHYTEYIIPLPVSVNNIITESFWNKKYNEVVYHIIQPLFKSKERILIHTHTLNLIDLALYIKTKVDCKIITHLHCIPWKGLYNRDMDRFNQLYETAYLYPLADGDQRLISSPWELRSYTLSDRIICVTHCGHDFVRKTVKGSLPPIDVVSNGMDDFYDGNGSFAKTTPLSMIYVGTISPSKGLPFILEALRKVKKRGYDVRLQVAGGGNPIFIRQIRSEYRDLSLDMLGQVPFDKLIEYYTCADIGIIASLQEQASYVAVEMAMFGLPIITTSVDGLDETFTDGIDALKVGVVFSKEKGLSVDVGMMADKIVELIENKEKRLSLGRNARNLYATKLALRCMVENTVAIYRQVIKID